MGASIVFVAVLAVVVAAVVGYRIYRARWLAGLNAAAASVGMEFALGDPYKTIAMPFALFDEGDRRGITWTMSKPGLVVCELWYVEKQGENQRTYRFTCAIKNLSTRWPHLLIRRESLLGGVRDALGFRDLQFESDEFNKRFYVKCDDPRFASAFVDARMMAWLLDSTGKARFETTGQWLMCATPRVPSAEISGVIEYLEAFRNQIPAVVADLYPNQPR